MKCFIRLFVFLSFILFINPFVIAQTATRLPRGVPEAEGVSSKDISSFLDAAAKSKTEFHSFMLLRHGKVIAEGWWNPYRADLKHTLYSCSKSFTATAIGFALHEKKLSLDDKVISFFPNDLPDTVSPWLAELTVKDALMMSDGQDPDPSSAVSSHDSNWIKGFLSTPLLHKPGTTFLYNSLGTYMLSAIVQKATGEKTIDYLKTRLFVPLGVEGEDWETDLHGVNTGGWGLRLKSEDMAKFAQLFLQKGRWNGKQLLPPSWAEEASTMKIMQDPNATQAKKDSSDWLQGYCYQMWRCRHNAFRGDGAYGQFMIVMPDQDAVLAITAETPDMQEEINLVWKYLLPAFREGKLPANENGDKQLLQKIKALALPLSAESSATPVAGINGKIFTLEPNKLNLQSISINFLNNVCMIKLHDNASEYVVKFGAGKWEAGVTNMPGPSLTATAIENNSMIYPAKVDGSYIWSDARTLQLVLRYIESPHTETYICRFDGNGISINAGSSFNYGKKDIILKGEVR